MAVNSKKIHEIDKGRNSVKVETGPGLGNNHQDRKILKMAPKKRIIFTYIQMVEN